MATVFTNAQMNVFKDIILRDTNNSGSRFLDTVEMYHEPVKDGAWITHQETTYAGDRALGNQASPNVDLTFNRIKLTATPMNWSTLLDDVDINRLVSDPTQITALNAHKALGRNVDGRILKAAVLDSVTQGDASTVAFDSANYEIDATAGAGVTAGTDIVAAIKTARQKLEEADLDLDTEEVTIFMTPKEKALLLETDEFKNFDYNGSRSYEKGNLMDGWYGFNYRIRADKWSTDHGTTTTAIIPEVGADRYLPVIVKSGVTVGMAGSEQMKVRVAEDPTMSFGNRIYLEQDMGAVRTDAKKVLRIKVDV